MKAIHDELERQREAQAAQEHAAQEQAAEDEPG
jgi:hypothetical protein